MVKGGEMSKDKFHEDWRGWYYTVCTNKFGEHVNPYDLSQRRERERGDFTRKKVYVKIKKKYRKNK